MTGNPVGARRSIGESSVTIGVILIVLLGCADRSTPPSPSAKAVSGQSGLALLQVPGTEMGTTIEAYLIHRSDPALGLLTRPEQLELTEL